ncbi:MAG: radical SAM protein, partial [Desulfobulbaceae bacterium]|nr:radical SAM protein [Desulfobulbaceae bacterium]
PWARCSFCTHHHTYIKFRTLEIDECIRHIRVLKKRYQTDYFYFYDEMISANRFRELAGKFIDEDLGIYYGAYAKPVSKFDNSLLQQIHKSGCRVLLWGVESASQRLLDLMRKGTNIHDMKKVLAESGSVGIMNLVFIMFGFPTETKEEFFLTFDFLDRNRSSIHALSKGKFMLTEGSLIHREPDKFSITGIREKQYWNTLDKVLEYEVSNGLDHHQLAKLYRENLKRLHKIGLSSRFGSYREHLLVYAARQICEIK